MRQTRINTQNMIVLTVEFNRIPLFLAGKKQFSLRHRPYHSLTLKAPTKSQELVTPGWQIQLTRRTDEQ
jgi:hypothetical protein